MPFINTMDVGLIQNYALVRSILNSGSETDDSTIPFDLRCFESLNRIVQAEPRLERDATEQGKAALRSMFELKNKMLDKSVDLYFGPKALIDHEGEWINT